MRVEALAAAEILLARKEEVRFLVVLSIGFCISYNLKVTGLRSQFKPDSMRFLLQDFSIILT